MRSPVLKALFLTLGLLVLAAAPACLLQALRAHDRPHPSGGLLIGTSIPMLFSLLANPEFGIQY